MNNFFKLKEHETNIRTELLAGLTSFFAAVYIIVVNASILSDGGVSMEPLISIINWMCTSCTFE